MSEHAENLILTWLAKKRSADATKWWVVEQIARGVGIVPARVEETLEGLKVAGRVRCEVTGRRAYWKGSADGDR